jgi:tetratricopeptide (TPR) repeat protein
MSNYLVLHIDLEFIAGIVCVDNGQSYSITNGNEDLLWLYFFNDPHHNQISFGKNNKEHSNNSEINYYGRFFDAIETNQNTFILRGIEKPLIELLECSGLLDIIKKKYKSITIEIPDNIPTLLSFSASIRELPRQKTIEYLGNHGFQINSHTIPLSELVCYYCLSQKKFFSKVGDTVVFLEATNATLHLMKLVFFESYFLLDVGKRVSYSGKGLDPRKQAIVRFVVNEINKSTGILITDEEKEKECERLESKAEECLEKLDVNQNPNRPLHISSSFSKAPYIIKTVLVRKNDVENDTGSYIQKLMDIFDTYKKENVQADVSAIFLLGDCFRNSFVKDRFEKIMNREKLFFYSNENICQILSVYPQIDINRYAHIEARIKEIAQAEESKKAKELALENTRKKEEEAEQKRQVDLEKAERAREEAKQLVERARDLQKNGKLQDAYTNIENALTLDPENVEYQKYLKSLNDNIEERNRKTEQYKSLLIKADKNIENNDLPGALRSYELAKNIFDSAEIREKINEIKEKIKIQEEENKFNEIIKNADSYFQAEDLDEAEKQYQAALEVIPNQTYCLEQLIKIQEIVQQQEERQRKCIVLVKYADQLFDEKNWFHAKEKYEEALKLCPKEKSLLNKVKICELELFKIDDKFKDLILEANVAKGKEDSQKELFLLKEASKIKPENKEVLSRIKRIEFDLKFNEKEIGKEKNDDRKILDNTQNKNNSTTSKDDFLGNNKIAKIPDKDFLNRNPKKISKTDEDFLNPLKRK